MTNKLLEILWTSHVWGHVLRKPSLGTFIMCKHRIYIYKKVTAHQVILFYRTVVLSCVWSETEEMLIWRWRMYCVFTLNSVFPFSSKYGRLLKTWIENFLIVKDWVWDVLREQQNIEWAKSVCDYNGAWHRHNGSYTWHLKFERYKEI